MLASLFIRPFVYPSQSLNCAIFCIGQKSPLYYHFRFFYQSMAVGLTSENGQNVQHPVEEELKLEQEPVLTLLQPMVVHIVLGSQ